MLTSLLATTAEGATNVNSSLGAPFWIIYAAVVILLLVGMAKMFSKAGQPAWGAIIPIYNTLLLLRIAGRPAWWFVLFLIPVINLIVTIVVGIDVAKRFGHGPVYGAIVCGILSIGYVIIGFDSSQYSAQA